MAGGPSDPVTRMRLSMPKDEWGVKRTCPECQTRFYDLTNDPMTCPACGAELTPDSFLPDKARAERAQAPAQPQKEETEDILETNDDVLDDDAEVDDQLLDEDDDEDNVSLDEIADVAADEDDS